MTSQIRKARLQQLKAQQGGGSGGSGAGGSASQGGAEQKRYAFFGCFAIVYMEMTLADYFFFADSKKVCNLLQHDDTRRVPICTDDMKRHSDTHDTR